MPVFVLDFSPNVRQPRRATVPAYEDAHIDTNKLSPYVPPKINFGPHVPVIDYKTTKPSAAIFNKLVAPAKLDRKWKQQQGAYKKSSRTSTVKKSSTAWNKQKAALEKKYKKPGNNNKKNDKDDKEKDK